MAYFAPYIDETGLHTPLYADIRDEMISQMKQIFGNDIYIEEDSMDYQQISIFARKVFDANNTLQLAYNNRTPITAIGVGLDNDVVYAGIARKQASKSTVELLLSGFAGAVIDNGEAFDGTNLWQLPATVTIPESGTIYIQATAKEAGNILALPNTITTIATPIYGWTAVTNEAAASPGQAIETDAQLRGRFGNATKQTSQTVFDGIQAALESVNEVTRVRGYENDTGAESTPESPGNIPAGLPAHSVTFVVEGGTDLEVATEIFFKKTPGCYTNGTTAVQLESITGNITIIRFYRPTYKKVFVRLALQTLQGYNEEYVEKIKQAIVEYSESLQLAEVLYRSAVWSIAMLASNDVKMPAYSVTNVEFSVDGTTWVEQDIIQELYEAVLIDEADITLEVS